MVKHFCDTICNRKAQSKTFNFRVSWIVDSTKLFKHFVYLIVRNPPAGIPHLNFKFIAAVSCAK